jgi:hypothetical protein
MHEFDVPQEENIFGCHVLDYTFLTMVGALRICDLNDVVTLHWVAD